MDIDLIVAASGAPPDTATSLQSGGFPSYHGAGSYGTSSVTSMSPQSLTHSGLASEESSVYAYGTSPQSLPANFGLSSSTVRTSPAPLMYTEPTRPYKRNKRNSSQSGTSSATLTPSHSTTSTSTSTSTTSATGSMESMMFGWKLTKPPKYPPGSTAGDGLTEPPRKRSKSAKSSAGAVQSHAGSIASTAQGPNANHVLNTNTANTNQTGGTSPQMPFTSPLHHPHQRGVAPPVAYGVYNPAAQARFQAQQQAAQAQQQAGLAAAAYQNLMPGVTPGMVNNYGNNLNNMAVPPSAMPAYLAMVNAQLTASSTPSSPSEYASSMLVDASSPHASMLYAQSSPLPASGFDLARTSPMLPQTPATALSYGSAFANYPLAPNSSAYHPNTINSGYTSPSQNSLYATPVQAFSAASNPTYASSQGSGYHSPTNAGSPRTPTFLGGLGLSPLSITPLAASAPPTSPLSSSGNTWASPPNTSGFAMNQPDANGRAVGLPGSNGTSAFTVVPPRRSSNPDLKDSKDKSAPYSPPDTPSPSSKKKKKLNKAR